MRLTPARAQIGIAALMGVASVMLLVTTLGPQFQQAGQHQQSEGLAMLASEYTALPALESLPHLNRNNPSQWEKAVVAPLKTAAQGSHIQIDKLTGSALASEPVANLPPTIQQVPLTVTATGSYPALEVFQQKLMVLFPYITLREMNYELKSDATTPPGGSPVVEATWVFHLIADMS